MADQNKEKVLYYLDELSGYKVGSDYSDVRGWEVVDADNRTIGEVNNLLVNKESERVVYLDVEVDENLAAEARKMQELPASEGAHGFMNEKGENHLIIPIGAVSLDEDNKKVFTKDIAHDKFVRTQWINKGAHIDRDYEMKTFKNYFPDGSLEDSHNRDFYNRREFGHNRI